MNRLSEQAKNFKGDIAVLLCPKCGEAQYANLTLSAEERLAVHLKFGHGPHMGIHPLVSHGICSVCRKRDMVDCEECRTPHRINQLFQLRNGELRCLKHVLEPEKITVNSDGSVNILA